MVTQNVVIFIGSNNPYKHKRGVENVILFQSKMLGDCKKYYLFFDDENSNFTWEDITCHGVKNNALKIIKINNILKNILQKEKDNKVYIHSHNQLITAILYKRTNLLTVHDGLYYIRKSANHPLKFLHWLIEKTCYMRSDKVHFISNFTKNNTLYKNNNDVLIYDTTHLEFIKDKVIYDKNKFEFENKFIIFTVRGIQERTRIDLLIEVAKVLKEKSIKINGKEIVIYIAGKGEMLDYYRAKIIELDLTNNIVLLGYIDDNEVCTWYELSDLVIVTASYGEGFGMPIIEGYLLNKPVIASNCCAIPEIIIDNKYLFENNTEDIINRILMFSDSVEVGQKYYNYYLENFSVEVIKKKYVDTLFGD